MVRMFGAALLALAFSSAAFADDVTEVVAGNKVTVKAGTVVRLPVKGIAGTEIKGKITGDGKLKETHVIEIANGKPVIGNTNLEFEVTTGKAGTITLEVTKRPPNGKEEKITLEITVQ